MAVAASRSMRNVNALWDDTATVCDLSAGEAAAITTKTNDVCEPTAIARSCS